MSKFRNSLVLVAAVGLTACGGMLGGPSDSTVEDAARQSLIESAPEPEMAKIAKDAKISKRGMCNTDAEPGVHVCMVDITVKMPGEAQETTKTFVAKMKEIDGKWTSVD